MDDQKTCKNCFYMNEKNQFHVCYIRADSRVEINNCCEWYISHENYLLDLFEEGIEALSERRNVDYEVYEKIMKLIKNKQILINIKVEGL